MVKLEAIIEVSQGLDNGSVPSKYIKNFDVLGETLIQKKTMKEQILTQSRGAKSWRDLPVPSNTSWSFSNGLQPACSTPKSKGSSKEE